MSFILHVTSQATADLDAIHASLNEFSERAADRTCNLIKDGIRGLSDFPRAYAVARESAGFAVEIRQLIVGNYRVLYQIIGSRIVVMRIGHASRKTLGPMDLM